MDQSLRQAERLRRSILKRVFEGKLVPQDSTDEPAEKLLERIRAEKAAQMGAPRKPVRVTLKVFVFIVTGVIMGKKCGSSL